MSSLNKGWIQTRSLKRVSPMEITAEDIDLEDIAYALSHRYRFAGHSHRGETVAQHSVLVALACPKEYQIHGLLHDVAEAYLGDIVSPLKDVLPVGLADWVRGAEALVNVAVYKKLGIEGPTLKARDAVRLADQRALVTEVELFWDGIRPDFKLPNVSRIILDPARPNALHNWIPSQAAQAFTSALDTLMRGEPLTRVLCFQADEV